MAPPGKEAMGGKNGCMGGPRVMPGRTTGCTNEVVVAGEESDVTAAGAFGTL